MRHAEILASEIKKADSFEDVQDQCDELCEYAGLGDEWANADGENFIYVLSDAAQRLHIDCGV